MVTFIGTKRRGDVGGDHVRASRQHLHQQQPAEVVNVARPVKTGRNISPRPISAHQAGAQLDQVGKQGLGNRSCRHWKKKGAAASAAATALGGLASAAGRDGVGCAGRSVRQGAALDALLLAGASGSATV